MQHPSPPASDRPRLLARTAGLGACLLFCAALTTLAVGRDDRIPVNAGTDFGRELYAPPEQEGFSFMIFGDRTGGGTEDLSVLDQGIRAANLLDADFALTVGDVIEGYCGPRTWMKEAEQYHEHMKSLEMPWFPVVGNHDVYGSRRHPEGNIERFKEHFGPLYYSFDYRWAHFIALFSDEALSFSDYARDQNFGAEQLAWLRDDLANTDATQIYVFLHHPRWSYAGTNWPEVHELLSSDGRTQAVIAGHLHTWRDDGITDGVHYHVLGATGGVVGDLVETAQDHRIAHVRVRPDGYTMSFLPTGVLDGSDMVTRDELYEMGGLARGGWARLEGRARLDAEARMESELAVVVENPGARAMDVTLRFDQGGDWHWRHELSETHLEPGASMRIPVTVGAPRFDGTRPRAALEVALEYRCASGAVQPIRHGLDLAYLIPGATAAARLAPERNGVLKVDGNSAVRVPWPERLDRFTLECRARGTTEGSWQGVIGKTQSSGYSLTVADGAIAGNVMVEEGSGYVKPTATTPLDEQEWRHYAFVWDGERALLFVNGVLEGEKPAAGELRDNGLPLFIGADTDGNGNSQNPFVGEIDEVRVSNVARYAEEFEPPLRHEPDEATMLLLHFDRLFGGEVGAGIFPDASGRDHHGWPVGSPRIVEEGP